MCRDLRESRTRLTYIHTHTAAQLLSVLLCICAPSVHRSEPSLVFWFSSQLIRPVTGCRIIQPTFDIAIDQEKISPKNRIHPTGALPCACDNYSQQFSSLHLQHSSVKAKVQIKSFARWDGCVCVCVFLFSFRVNFLLLGFFFILFFNLLNLSDSLSSHLFYFSLLATTYTTSYTTYISFS